LYIDKKYWCFYFGEQLMFKKRIIPSYWQKFLLITTYLDLILCVCVRARARARECVCVCVYIVLCIIYGQKLLELEALLEVVLILHFSKITKIKASIFLINVQLLLQGTSKFTTIFQLSSEMNVSLLFEKENIRKKSSNRRYTQYTSKHIFNVYL